MPDEAKQPVHELDRYAAIVDEAVAIKGVSLGKDAWRRLRRKRVAMVSLWLLIALALYATILLVAFFIQRPGVRRLLGLKQAATEEEKERWRIRARRQRYISYAMAAAIGVIGWLMMSKPTFFQ